MQKNSSWGGVQRYPLDSARIAAALIEDGHQVMFLDLQNSQKTHLTTVLKNFKPNHVITSCGFPSIRSDNLVATHVKEFSRDIYVSTYGVVPTLLGEKFFMSWDFKIEYDFVITGGDPALGYQRIMKEESIEARTYHSLMSKQKQIDSRVSRPLFNHDLYRSPITGQRMTCIEGSYGCPRDCSFCVVPQLYGKKFSIRKAQQVVEDVKGAVTNYGIRHFTLWDEGTTFSKKQLLEICRGLTELQSSSSVPKFIWSTRSTTKLVTEETVEAFKKSGLVSLTLGLESFNQGILSSTGKGTTIEDNYRAINLLHKHKILSVGHIVLGMPGETLNTARDTISAVVYSKLSAAQFYCAVPYPGTPLHAEAREKDLIRVDDLTQYELSNSIMDTGHLSHIEVGDLRRRAMREFYLKNGSRLAFQMMQKGGGVNMVRSTLSFLRWF